MARAGFCNGCHANVWLNEAGGCPAGHGPEYITGVYEAAAPAQPPAAGGGPAPQYAQPAPGATAAVAATGFAPCPKCGSTTGQKVGYTWWGGFLGPLVMNHTKCLSCGTTYNGKTGKSNTVPIVVYNVVILVVVLVFIVATANSR